MAKQPKKPFDEALVKGQIRFTEIYANSFKHTAEDVTFAFRDQNESIGRVFLDLLTADALEICLRSAHAQAVALRSAHGPAPTDVKVSQQILEVAHIDAGLNPTSTHVMLNFHSPAGELKTIALSKKAAVTLVDYVQRSLVTMASATKPSH